MGGYERWTELVRLPAPAAGAAFKRKVDARTYEMPLIVRFILTTSAAVANRVPIIALQDGDGTEYCRFTSGITVAASSIVAVTFAAGYGATPTGSSTFATAPMSHVLIPPGFTLTCDAAALDVGDTITSVSLWVKRFPTGESGEPSGAVPYEPETTIVVMP
jgi:hypothetical protein